MFFFIACDSKDTIDHIDPKASETPARLKLFIAFNPLYLFISINSILL